VLDVSSLLPGTALWALALYLPLSVPLARLEEALSEGALSEGLRQIVLVTSSVLLAFAVGAITQLLLSLILSPSWAASLGLMAVLAGAFWAVASSNGNDEG
jgi:hypothetical protein